MKQERIKLAWAIGQIADGIGNAYGYNVHNTTLRKYVGMIADLDPNAQDVLWIISPEGFRAIEGRTNWLFTMFEGDSIPDKYKGPISKAEYLLAPSKWVKELFDKNFPDKECFVVNHGVENVFEYKKRYFPRNRPFRYLWVGAPNPRKGWQEIIHAWTSVFKDRPEFELYVKTTRVEGVQKKSNVILDGRNLSIKELVKLYHDSHCFVFPTRGEGFGLTLAEAMRTGLPCISTYYSGVCDFFDDMVGHSINYTMGEGKVTFIGDGTTASTNIAFPHVDEMVDKMIEVYKNYDEALKLGERASRRISSRFTWPMSAKRLVDLIREHGNGTANKNKLLH